MVSFGEAFDATYSQDSPTRTDGKRRCVECGRRFGVLAESRLFSSMFFCQSCWHAMTTNTPTPEEPK